MVDMTDTTMTQWACDSCPFRARAQVKGLVLNDDGRIYWHQQRIKLTFCEYKIVKLLTAEPGRIRSGREIYDVMRSPGFKAGEGDNGFDSTVRSAIKRLRCKFRLVQPEFSHIKNYNSFGYAWE